MVARELGDGVCSAAMAERRGALLLANWRGAGAWMKQISKLSGAWRRRGHDGLTCGGSIGVRPPLGARGLSSVGHD